VGSRLLWHDLGQIVIPMQVEIFYWKVRDLSNFLKGYRDQPSDIFPLGVG
jgi:hypothetical protein